MKTALFALALCASHLSFANVKKADEVHLGDKNFFYKIVDSGQKKICYVTTSWSGNITMQCHNDTSGAPKPSTTAD